MIEYGYFTSTGTPPDITSLRAPLSFDIEATGKDIARDGPLGVSVAMDHSSAYWFPIDSSMLKTLGTSLTVGHNLKYDRSMLKKAGVQVSDKLIDTLIAGHLLGKSPLDLKTLALSGLEVRLVTYADIGKSFEGMSLNDMAKFSGAHSIASAMLWELFERDLRRFRMLDIFYNIEMPLIPVLSDMELNGVMVDPVVLESLGREFAGKIAAIDNALNSYTGSISINYNSPDQVAHLLFDVMGLPPGRMTNKGKRPSTEAKVLESLKNKSPIVSLLLQRKRYDKLKGNYADGLLKTIIDDRIHCSFNQEGTRTGRLSSSDPNLQNIPQRSSEGRKIRMAFIAPPGYSLIRADCDQLELRVMAHCAQDLVMISAFNEGKDIHEETAIRAFGDKKFRGPAKTLNYQIVYGGGEAGLKKKFFTAYPGIAEWTRRTHRIALEDGYVKTLGGRIRVLPELRSDNSWMVKHGLNEAISTIVQGTSAETVKVGMRRAWEKFRGTDVKMILQVHDEVVFEVPDSQIGDAIEVIREALTYKELSVPLPVTVEVGKSWGNMKEVS